MLIFLIGPSRAGKSTLLREVKKQFPNINFIDLDVEEDAAIKKLRSSGVTDFGGWPGRWTRSRALLDKTEAEIKNTIVDVGAGCLQTKEAFNYFNDRTENIILITAPVDAILERHSGRDPDELRKTEFSPDHLALYSKVGKSIDTSTLSIEAASEKLQDYIRTYE